MSVLLDVFYNQPDDAAREARFAEIVGRQGAASTAKDTDESEDHQEGDGPVRVWLQYEFEDFDAATLAQKEILKNGEWAEPPWDIGD